MGTPGVPCNLTEDLILDAIKKASGRMNKIAEILDLSMTCAREHLFRYPECVKLLANERNKRDESLLNGAEDTLQYAIDQRDKDVNAALKSSFFVLNNKGKLRGYIAPQQANDENLGKLTPQQITDAINSSE